ncbi:hypothetical protein [Nocardia sp. alder85J]|uniref:hypothetical protein n=1 Tax=Nocardia sp. alder85J TaxID=2862949 RepID=UPI001CD4E7DE|nr:hypothetical protein [Nocardia sp. alder85J]MCX4092702.1 hypothetical protein [Nocardia sp. alder85J]
MIIVIVLLLALVVIIGGVAGVLLVVGNHQRREAAHDNQVIPGTPTRAPVSWARSHDPEARLHRRLRDAMTALHAVAAYDTAASLSMRSGLEQSALAVDHHLVAVAGLPRSHRDQQLPELTRAVETIEAGVADYTLATTKPDLSALEADLSAVQSKLDAVTEIRRTLDHA